MVNADAEIRKGLNELVLNSSELRELQTLVGQFNVFRVLGIEENEIRHSNVLAWLLSPEESHGLAGRFLRHYLMLVSYQTESEFIDPIEIDTAKIRRCEVLREWKNIDLLLDIDVGSAKWLVIIENKVKSKQSLGQLERYRKRVQSYSNGGKYSQHDKFFILLSRDGEEPDDTNYVVSTYDQVHQALRKSLEECAGQIGPEPEMVLRNYLQLLERKFMSESQIKSLAQKIYKAHKVAIDTIIEHKPVARERLSEFLHQQMSKRADFIVLSATRARLLLIPREWDTEENRAGVAWGDGGAYVLISLRLRDESIMLKIISGRAPEDLVERLFERAQRDPFKTTNRSLRKSPIWVTYDSTSLSSGSLLADGDEDSDELLHQRIWAEVCSILESPGYREKIRIFGEQMKDYFKRR